MKFLVTTEGGSEFEMKDGQEIELEINGKIYSISIERVD